MRLIGNCECSKSLVSGTNHPRVFWEQDCFHGACTQRRVFRSTGRYLLENAAGYVKAFDPEEVQG